MSLMDHAAIRNLKRIEPAQRERTAFSFLEHGRYFEALSLLLSLSADHLHDDMIGGILATTGNSISRRLFDGEAPPDEYLESARSTLDANLAAYEPGRGDRTEPLPTIIFSYFNWNTDLFERSGRIYLVERTADEHLSSFKDQFSYRRDDQHPPTFF